MSVKWNSDASATCNLNKTMKFNPLKTGAHRQSKEGLFYNLLTVVATENAIDLQLCIAVDKSLSRRVGGAFVPRRGKVRRYISARRKVLEISVTKFGRANKPHVTTTDERKYPITIRGHRHHSRTRVRRAGREAAGRSREALTNFWRILYAHAGIVPNFNCSVSYSFAPSHHTALFPHRRFADSFFAPQIARVVYVPGPPAPRRAIQPLFCLAVVAPVCSVSSRLAQSVWMVIKSALLHPTEKRCIIIMRVTHAYMRLHVRTCKILFIRHKSHNSTVFIWLADKLSIVLPPGKRTLARLPIVLLS